MQVHRRKRCNSRAQGVAGHHKPPRPAGAAIRRARGTTAARRVARLLHQRLLRVLTIPPASMVAMHSGAWCSRSVH